jgi:hypothetical protein
LLRELRLLERRTHRSGKDSVDHGRTGHDDFANAVCGALHTMSAYDGSYPLSVWLAAFGNGPSPPGELHPLYASYAMAPTGDARDVAYREMCDQLCNAWRG